MASVIIPALSRYPFHRFNIRTVCRILIVRRFSRMQPPPLPNTQKVSYQVPRDVLIRIWWRRMMLRPRCLAFIAILVLTSALCIFLFQDMQYVGFACLGMLVAMTNILYRAVAKAVDNDRILTDPKTLEFGASQLVLTGPDWKSEMPWTRFNGFSEDVTYFYLHLSDNGIASVIPKSAFTSEQQQLFRQYAQTRNA